LKLLFCDDRVRRTLFQALASAVLRIDILSTSVGRGVVALYAPLAVHQVRYFSIFQEDRQ
jgi:hypothetical protein